MNSLQFLLKNETQSTSNVFIFADVLLEAVFSVDPYMS